MGVIGKFSVLCRVLGLTGFLDQCWQKIVKFSPKNLNKSSNIKATLNSTRDSIKSKYS